MGLADLFLATDDEIATAFPGWQRPAPLLDQFVTTTRSNPFTGTATTIRTLIPAEQPEPDPDAAADGDFRHLPRIDQKGLSTIEVISLASVVMGWDADRSDSEVHGRLFIGPPDAEVWLCQISPALVARLAELGPDQCSALGTAWSSHRRADAATIPNKVIRNLLMARPDSEWIARLSEISNLARRGSSEGRSMFLWMSL